MAETQKIGHGSSVSNAVPSRGRVCKVSPRTETHPPDPRGKTRWLRSSQRRQRVFPFPGRGPRPPRDPVLAKHRKSGSLSPQASPSPPRLSLQGLPPDRKHPPDPHGKTRCLRSPQRCQRVFLFPGGTLLRCGDRGSSGRFCWGDRKFGSGSRRARKDPGVLFRSEGLSPLRSKFAPSHPPDEKIIRPARNTRCPRTLPTVTAGLSFRGDGLLADPACCPRSSLDAAIGPCPEGTAFQSPGLPTKVATPG